MRYTIRQWPSGGVYPDEINRECPEALEIIDVFLMSMMEHGPSPPGYPKIKTLGQKHEGLWQANLKVARKQVRILYAPYGNEIVLFRIHKKSSQPEQDRAYELATKRKREYERARKINEQTSHDGSRTLH